MKRQHCIGLLVLCLSNRFPLAATHAQQLEWIRQLGAAGYDENSAVKADASGIVYISGGTPGSLGGPNAGDYDAFVTKYDTAGNLLWTQQLGTTQYDKSTGVSADSLGNVFISGITFGALGGPYAGSQDVFVSKYNGDGILEWTRQLGTSSADYSGGISADSLGNVYISGTTNGNLGGPNVGGGDVFLSKYDTAGTLLWTRQFGSVNYEDSYDVFADSLGNTYISGFTSGVLGGHNFGMFDAFVTKFDASGSVQWTRQLGTVNGDASTGVAADLFGNDYVSGQTLGNLERPNVGLWDSFVCKLDAYGNLQWTRQIGTAANDGSIDITADSFGNAYISGYTGGSLGASNAGGYDAFVNKYDTTGNLIWLRQFGTASDDESDGVTLDGFGYVYVSGITQGSLGGLSAGDYDVFIAKYSTIPEPGTLLLATLASVALLLPRARRQTERTLISTNLR